MKKITIIIISMLLVSVVSTSGTAAIWCDCANNECSIDGRFYTGAACAPCGCGGSSSGSASASTRPVDTEFLKKNYHALEFPDAATFDRLRNLKYSPITEKDGAGYGPVTSAREELYVSIGSQDEAYDKFIRAERGKVIAERKKQKEESAWGAGMINLLKKSNAKSAAVERYQAKGMVRKV